MYNQEDMRRANALVSRYALMLGLGLAILLAAYVLAIRLGSQSLMLAIALSAFWFVTLESCVFLRPAVQYRNFLRDMNAGLRRESFCLVDGIDGKIILQDGVRVRTLHALLDDGDSRIFYLNISKDFPRPGSKIHLISYGRHVVQWKELPQ